MRRVIWLVLDSVGIGAMADAGKFGDEGANTFLHTWSYNGELKIPNIIKMGIGNIDGMSLVPKADKPLAAYGKCEEMSNGKDTTVGHWEMAGVISKMPFPTFPDGFPPEVIDEFVKKTGVPGVLANCTASGTERIKQFGDEHLATGKPIVYTSADSVFQIAVNVEKFGLEELYRQCETARQILVGQYEVARVIARPFIVKDGEYVRTSDRRDYAILPPEHNLLNTLKKRNCNVMAVGKIEDIFAGSGITEAVHTKNNMDGVDKTLEYMAKADGGLIFTNLVEFDSSWGHRRDAGAYGKGLEAFDARLPEIVEAMKEEDVLIINADHGCDPTFKGTDHTREYIPVLIYGDRVNPVNFSVRKSFADIGHTISLYLTGEPILNGEKIDVIKQI